MSCNQTIEELQKQLELLATENKQLKQEILSLKEAHSKKPELSFRERYAVKILESLPDMLTVFDYNETGIEVVSSERTNHISISNKDFGGMRLCDMIPEETYQNVHSNMQNVIATGQTSTSHHVLETNGERCYYENRIFPLDNDYLLMMCRDITESVKIRRSLGVFKSVLDKVSDSVLALSNDGTLVYANKQFIEEYGVTQDLGTQKIYDLSVSMCTKELWESRLEKIRKHEGSYAYRAEYVRKGETKERVHQVSTHIMQENQKEIIWLFTQDITDIVRKRDELRELNILLDGILNSIPVYLFVKDTGNDFRYLYWNKAFSDYSKIPASHAIGRTDFEIFPDRADAEKFHQDDLELVKTRERIDIQESYVTATGETRVVQTLKTLVPMEGRQPLLIGVSWDITDLETVEKELIHARIKAEQSDRLKSAFLANMSHEIRTPLNAIVGFSKLLALAENPDDEQLYSDIINKNSDTLLQLINDILDLSKIEAGTLEYIRQPMNLRELCQTVYEVHKEHVQEGVTLVWDNQECGLVINEDQNRIMQVITNLITNAIKFTRQGEIRFGFNVQTDYINFYVEDTGIGIDAEKVNHVFDRFVKLNAFAQGTGLGLAICKMIIEKIGGEIGVTSEAGKGSTFHFTIPYKKEENLRVKRLSDWTTPTYHSTRKGQPLKTILVAEDVDSNFLLLSNIIGKNYTLLRAKDGIEAVNLFKEHQPDLILMDIKMPHMDGYEATRLIRSYSTEIPIIALTAYAFEADREKAAEAGCNDFITKPISEEKLAQILAKY